MNIPNAPLVETAVISNTPTHPNHISSLFSFHLQVELLAELRSASPSQRNTSRPSYSWTRGPPSLSTGAPYTVSSSPIRSMEPGASTGVLAPLYMGLYQSQLLGWYYSIFFSFSVFILHFTKCIYLCIS